MNRLLLIFSTIIIVFAGIIVACEPISTLVIDPESKSIVHKQSTSIQIDIQELNVLNPIAYENLQLFPIVAKAQVDSRHYITLSEAMKNGLVKLNETGSVNQLSIDNNSADYIFIQAGDIVKGGKQDRTLQTDLIIPPKAQGVDLNSFCVEQGRWQKRENEQVGYFSSSESNLASRDLKIASKKQGNQNQVWGKVKEQQDKLKKNVSERYGDVIEVENDISKTSYQLTLENGKLEEYKQEYKNSLSKVFDTQNILGIAYAINGEIYGIDVFNSAQLFNDLSIKLLDAFIVEAIGHKDGEKANEKTTVVEVSNVLDIHLNNKPTASNVQKLNEITQYTYQEFGLVNRYETVDADFNQWIHLNYLIASTDNLEPELDYTPRR